ncbi:MAG: hypothetical protein HY748_07775 [Elusimicrobia bacterium]|nr:hypothetical protein [Elusimicrobiota bacterium]
MKRLILLAAILGAGCASLPGDAPPSTLAGFPIGIYNVEDPAHLAVMKESGFDTFFGIARDFQGYERLSRAARKLGMRMILDPRPFLDKPASSTKGWPVLAWYLQDEPDVNRVTPEALAEFSRKVKAWDPSRLQTFVVGQGSAAKAYGNTSDALMVDWYPVPHKPLGSVAEQLEIAARAVPKGKPVWMVLQAFDWSEDGSTKGSAFITRFPTFDEIRFMSYDSILSGAGGLFYFRLPVPGGETLLDYPERWQALARVTRELKLLQPVLEGGRPAALPFPPNPDGPSGRAWTHRGRSTLVLANRKRNAFQKVPDEALGSEWRPLFSLRRETRELLKMIGKAHYLRPHQVLVLEGPEQAAERSW